MVQQRPISKRSANAGRHNSKGCKEEVSTMQEQRQLGDAVLAIRTQAYTLGSTFTHVPPSLVLTCDQRKNRIAFTVFIWLDLTRNTLWPRFFRGFSSQVSAGVQVIGLPSAPSLSEAAAKTFRGVSTLQVTVQKPANTGQDDTTTEALVRYALQVINNLVQPWAKNHLPTASIHTQRLLHSRRKSTRGASSCTCIFFD
jgi:hypothetical protein